MQKNEFFHKKLQSQAYIVICQVFETSQMCVFRFFPRYSWLGNILRLLKCILKCYGNTSIEDSGKMHTDAFLWLYENGDTVAIFHRELNSIWCENINWSLASFYLQFKFNDLWLKSVKEIGVNSWSRIKNSFIPFLFFFLFILKHEVFINYFTMFVASFN